MRSVWKRSRLGGEGRVFGGGGGESEKGKGEVRAGTDAMGKGEVRVGMMVENKTDPAGFPGKQWPDCGPTSA